MTTEDPSIDDVRALESFIAGAGDGRLLLTFQGILRSHERMFHALSSPPADDVREALAAIVKRVSQKFGGPSLTEFANDPPIRKHYATADAILAAFVVNEVPGGCIYCSSSGVIEDYEGDRPCSNCDGSGTPRPRGPVTGPSDVEVLAALNATVRPESAAPDLSFWGEDSAAQMRASLKAAAEVRERAEA